MLQHSCWFGTPAETSAEISLGDGAEPRPDAANLFRLDESIHTLIQSVASHKTVTATGDVISREEDAKTKAVKAKKKEERERGDYSKAPYRTTRGASRRRG